MNDGEVQKPEGDIVLDTTGLGQNKFDMEISTLDASSWMKRAASRPRTCRISIYPASQPQLSRST